MRLSCRGILALILSPLVMLGVVGAVINPDLTVIERTGMGGFGLLLLSGYAFFATALLPERIGTAIGRVLPWTLGLGVVTVGLFAVWFGVNDVQSADADFGSWLTIAVGVFFIGVAGLLAFRRWLPWQRGDRSGTARMLGHGTRPSRIQLVDHRGETRFLEIPPTRSHLDISNSHGGTVSSRLAYRLLTADSDFPLRVTSSGVRPEPAAILATETTRAGSVTLMLPASDTVVQGLWRGAAAEPPAHWP